jgi:hypothetical protein
MAYVNMRFGSNGRYGADDYDDALDCAVDCAAGTDLYDCRTQRLPINRSTIAHRRLDVGRSCNRLTNSIRIGAYFAGEKPLGFSAHASSMGQSQSARLQSTASKATATGVIISCTPGNFSLLGRTVVGIRYSDSAKQRIWRDPCQTF